MSQQKDTIYIDIDDEITSIIDKVTSSKSKVVALVLPKRATVMQSIVNMRLLKRAADNAGKNLVLITSESSVLPLAGVAGVYTARTLQSKPEIPLVDEETADIQQPDSVTEEDQTIDETKPVGELAGDEDDIEVDNEDKEPEVAAVAAATAAKKSAKKDKKLKIPNFDSFRKKAFIGIGIFILVAVGWYIAFYVMPKATITIKTDATTSTVSVDMTANPSVTTIDEVNKIVPGKIEQIKKTSTQKAATTGEKNLGEKATGTVTMTTSTDCVTPVENIPAGTTVSSSNLNFVTQKSATFSPSGFDPGTGKCTLSTNKISVIAAEGGAKYNLSSRAYTVSGYGSVVANGSDMTGGTDKIVKVVSQKDVDSAKEKALKSDSEAVKKELSAKLTSQGYMPIPETFTTSEPVVTTSPKVGDEANEVTVTAETTYSMTGAKKDDVQKLIDNEAKKSIDTSKQSISDYGLNDADIRVDSSQPNGPVKFNVKTEVTTGTVLNADDIKNQVAGKRRGDTQDMLSSIPGVKSVDVSYSPFWVTKTPKNMNKITIVIENEGN